MSDTDTRLAALEQRVGVLEDMAAIRLRRRLLGD